MLTHPSSWSYTMLSNFENCPRKAWHLYVAKDLPRVETEAMRWGNMVHKALELRMDTGDKIKGSKVPLPPEMKDFEKFAAVFDGRRPRAEFWIGMDEHGRADSRPSKVWGKGKLDVLVLNNQEDEALIVDWKTGKRREDPFELEVFALLVRSMWPEVKRISGMYVWLQELKPGKVHELTDTSRTFAKVKEMWNGVKALNPEKEWLPTPNPLCGWCPVKTCEFNRPRS